MLKQNATGNLTPKLMKFVVPFLLAKKHSLSLCVPPYLPCYALFVLPRVPLFLCSLHCIGAHFNSSLSYSNCSIFCLPFISGLFQFAGVLLLGFISADHCSVFASSTPSLHSCATSASSVVNCRHTGYKPVPPVEGEGRGDFEGH
ncbi:uncharacterized protein DS421_6g193320 [Arachis hypogaea]|nr:uncharacterized protein DS421_6g193320 [Arachis hypogaea]